MKVSVIIPVYNAERYVAQAVESALMQPETGEVLLIEDASPDGALAVCQRLAEQHEKVRLLRHPNGENRGAGASRNLGIDYARCDLIAFLDADDYMLPGRFTHAVELLEQDSSVDGVYDAVTYVREDEGGENATIDLTSGNEVAEVHEYVPPEQLFLALLQGKSGWFCTNGIVARRNFINLTPRFNPKLRQAQDAALWVQMAAVGRLLPSGAEAPVAVYRRHDQNRYGKDLIRDRIWAVRMSEYLVRWSRKQKLSTEQSELLHQRYLKYWQWLINERDLNFAQKVYWFARRAALTPSSLVCPRFWHEFLWHSGPLKLYAALRQQ